MDRRVNFSVAVRAAMVVCITLMVGLIVFVVTGQAEAIRGCDPEMDWLDASGCRYSRIVQRAVVPTATPKPAPASVPVVAGPAGELAGVGIVPFTYAYVFTGPVPLYTDVSAIAAGSAARSLAAGYVWVRITGSETVNDQKYYRIKDGSYLPASMVTFVRPSAFAGVINPTHLPLGWMLVGTQVSSAAGAQPAAEAPSVARYQVVNIYEEQIVGEAKWYRIGEGQWIEQKRIGIVRPSPRPEGVMPGDKWLEVNLFEQTLMAYEGDHMVYATLVSSGLPRWSTIEGLFRAWAKVRYGTMYGAEGQADYYYLEDVPWTIYFHDDYAIHAAYWHDRFGYPHSHGCVNVPPLAARWIFEWTDPVLPDDQNAMYTKENSAGVWVWVHE